MADFNMKVGNAEIIALSDMNCAYPTPMAELSPAAVLAGVGWGGAYGVGQNCW